LDEPPSWSCLSDKRKRFADKMLRRHSIRMLRSIVPIPITADRCDRECLARWRGPQYVSSRNDFHVAYICDHVGTVSRIAVDRIRRMSESSSNFTERLSTAEEFDCLKCHWDVLVSEDTQLDCSFSAVTGRHGALRTLATLHVSRWAQH